MKFLCLLIIMIFVVPLQLFAQDELIFPETRAEIINALNPVKTRSIRVEPNVPKAGAKIHFDYNSDRIRPDAYDLLNLYTSILLDELSDIRLIVSGHTDNIGSDAFNLELSKARAMAVKNYLVARGVQADRLTIQWFGKSKPIKSNSTTEGRQKNRRVEFIRQ